MEASFPAISFTELGTRVDKILLALSSAVARANAEIAHAIACFVALDPNDCTSPHLLACLQAKMLLMDMNEPRFDNPAYSYRHALTKYDLMPSLHKVAHSVRTVVSTIKTVEHARMQGLMTEIQAAMARREQMEQYAAPYATLAQPWGWSRLKSPVQEVLACCALIKTFQESVLKTARAKFKDLYDAG